MAEAATAPDAVRSWARARTHETDAELVSASQQGDTEAFRELVYRYQDRMYNFVLRSVGDQTDAEDITQDILVRAYGGLPRFGGRASFQTWLFRIAYNRLADFSRRERTKRLRTLSLDGSGSPEEAGEMEVPDERGDPARRLERDELSGKVQEAILCLSDKLRTVVVLFDLEGLSYEEIAVVMGCPLGTVKSRLYHARAELRRRLSGYLGRC